MHLAVLKAGDSLPKSLATKLVGTVRLREKQFGASGVDDIYKSCGVAKRMYRLSSMTVGVRIVSRVLLRPCLRLRRKLQAVGTE